VVEESPTEPLPIVSPVGPPPDLPTTPLRIVAPGPSETDGPQNRADPDDAVSEDGQDDAETDDDADAADADAQEAPEPRSGPVGGTVSRVADHLLGG
jgi:hypothetical protein